MVELIVVICIIALFTVILIANFPKMMRQFALSRAVYELAQNIRQAQDLSLSGVQLNDIHGNPITVKGYGVYFNPTSYPTKYIIYADVAGAPDSNGNRVSDSKYDDLGNNPMCSSVDQTDRPLYEDCIMQIVDLTKEDASLSINSITNVDDNFTSVDFTPPGPITKIENLNLQYSGTEIILQVRVDNIERGVSVNTSGLISVQ